MTVICTTRCGIPASSSANKGPKTCDLVQNKQALPVSVVALTDVVEVLTPRAALEAQIVFFNDRDLYHTLRDSGELQCK